MPIMVSRQESPLALRSLRALRVTTLRKPLLMRLTRVAIWPLVRSSRARNNSRAAAAYTGSAKVLVPSHSRNRASVSGNASATRGSYTLRTSNVPSGVTKVAKTKAISGRASPTARRRCRACCLDASKPVSAVTCSTTCGWVLPVVGSIGLQRAAVQRSPADADPISLQHRSLAHDVGDLDDEARVPAQL